MNTSVVQSAITALAPFHPTRKQAKALLAMWKHRDTLTRTDVAAVLAVFPARARGGVA
jgi:hypothetical protein